MIADEVWIALDAYRQDKSAGRWTALSQLWVGEIQVLDAVQSIDPEFPDPLPLPADGLIEDDSQFFQWDVLPEPDTVERALRLLDEGKNA